MRIAHIATLLAVLFVASNAADGQDKREYRRKLRKVRKDDDTYLVVSTNRQTFVVPMTWKEVFFRYDRLPPTGQYNASAIFDFARLYDLDTLRSLDDSTLFRFGQAALADFFREFRPLSLERVFNSSPFDTVRSDSLGRVRHVPDMSRHFRLFLRDSSQQAVIDMLSRIPGIEQVHRPDRGIIQDAHGQEQ